MEKRGCEDSSGSLLPGQREGEVGEGERVGILQETVDQTEELPPIAL